MVPEDSQNSEEAGGAGFASDGGDSAGSRELLDQAGLDALLAAQREAAKSAPVGESASESEEAGPAPEIRKELIENVEVLERLLGRKVSDAEGSGAGAESGLLDQNSLDALLADQATRAQVTHSTSPASDVSAADFPVDIRKEAIDDPAVLEALLGKTAAVSGDEASSEGKDGGAGSDVDRGESGLLDQASLDVLIAEQAARGAPERQPIEIGDTDDGLPPLLIEKEAIHDVSLLSRLLGRDIDVSELEGEPEVVTPIGADLLDQKSVDRALAINAGDAAIANRTVDDLIRLSGEPPHIEKEPVDDPEVARLLLEGHSQDLDAGERIDQGDIDSLLETTMDGGNSVAETTQSVEEPDEAPASADSSAADGMDQSEIDALLADGASEASASADSSAADGMDQSEIDALLAGGASEVSASEDSSDSGGMDQSEIDALLAGGGVEGSVEATAEKEEAEGGGEGGAMDQSDIDALLAAPEEGGEDAPAPDPVAAAKEAAETLARAEAESGSEEDSDAEALDQDNIDALLAGKDDDDELTETAPERSIGDETATETPVGATKSKDEEEVLPQELVDSLLKEGKESVGAENLAAAASDEPPGGEEKAGEVAEVASEAVAAPAGESAEVAEAEEEAEGEVEGRGKVMAFVVPALSTVGPYVGANKAKVISSLAAGLVMFLGVSLFLALNPFRGVPAGSYGGLEDAIARARTLISEGSYGAAETLLEEAIEDAEPSLLRADAQYLSLEAMYRAFPGALRVAEGDAFYGAVDAVVGEAGTHSRAVEALMWKADVYDREGNFPAAKHTFNAILSNYRDRPDIDWVLFSAARMALSHEEFKGAADHLQRLLSEYPRSGYAGEGNLLLGDAYAQAERYDDARILYIRTAERHSLSKLGADASARLGELEFKVGNYDRAIDELEGRLERTTTLEGNDWVYLMLARTYRAAGRVEDARTLLDELLEFFPETKHTPLALVERSLVLEEMGMNKEAVRLARETVERYPTHPEVLANAGNLFGREGNPREAAKAFMAAEEAGANDPALMLAAAFQYRESKELQTAFDTLESLAFRYPRSDEAFEGSIVMGRILFEMGSVTRGVDRLEHLALATQGRRQRLPVLVALGELYVQLGMEERAAEIFGEIAGSTREPAMLAKASRTLFEVGAWDDGLSVARRVTVSKLDDARAYSFLTTYGAALLRQRKIDEGLGLMEEGYSSYPNERTPEGDQKLLSAYLVAGRSARARALVMELRGQVAQLQRDPKYLFEAANAWGDYLYERGDFREAADAYALTIQHSAEKDTEGHWAMYQRANALMKLSEFGESVELFDKVASLNVPWSKDAQAMAAYGRLEQRMRGSRVSGGTN